MLLPSVGHSQLALRSPFYRLEASFLFPTMDYNVSNGRRMIQPYPVNMGPGLMNYSPYFLLSQSPALSDISLPLDDLYRSQSAPPCLGQHNHFGSPLPIPPLFSDSDMFSLASSAYDGVHSSSKEHIPRPPNAFMLYRSHMLKSRGNADPEKRQQNLSRIAGQLWRDMSQEDRAVWHKKAAEVQAAHYAKYPHYKFRPNRRGTKSVAKTLQVSGYYLQPTEAEPSAGPVRRARSSRVRRKGVTHDDLLGAPETLFPSSVPSSSSSSPALSPLCLPPFLPTFSLPESMCSNEQANAILSRPQNALGLESSSAQLPAPGLIEMFSAFACDPDATPTAATFQRNGDIPQPDQAAQFQDDVFLGLEQLRLPHNSTDYAHDATHLSALVHGPVNGYQLSAQSYSCADAFGGATSCTSDSIFSEFGFPLSMPDHEHNHHDEWSDAAWMLELEKRLNI
ncbi:uncharacterized protein EDB91DRAFT_1100942 [Suillus paluster]|uniref:uncharacterized protein n=1 Tax=Suillus paluster TaxID=48578 RepID=UPI001B864363|nr:uncharacterized protein EDB91DRAFT_1100942 [Suillus paluster]KAG1753974.1 hypothetical protein EDB91DRAFT_1100942 [Suillus paluster]